MTDTTTTATENVDAAVAQAVAAEPIAPKAPTIDLCAQMATVLGQVADCLAPKLAAHTVGMERNEAAITATRVALQEQIDGSYRELIAISEKTASNERTLKDFFSQEVDRLVALVDTRFGSLDTRTLDLLQKINNEIEGDAGIVEMLKGVESVVFLRIQEFVQQTIIETVTKHVASVVPTITMACDNLGAMFCERLSGQEREHEQRIRYGKAG